jgi:hypothetical protein
MRARAGVGRFLAEADPLHDEPSLPLADAPPFLKRPDQADPVVFQAGDHSRCQGHPSIAAMAWAGSALPKATLMIPGR